MTYREYARKNGHTNEWIENAVGGLFGADAEMFDPVDITSTHRTYDMGGYLLHSNNSCADTVELVDGEGDVLESWILE